MTVNIAQLRRIFNRKHLKDYNLQQIFIDIGLYEDILLDCFSENSRPQDVCYGSLGDELLVSDDVKRFNEFWTSKESIILPCPICQKNEMTFHLQKAYKPSLEKENTPTKITVGQFGKYSLGDNSFGIIDYREYSYISSSVSDEWDEFCDECANDCKNTILKLGNIRKEGVCSYDDSHGYIVDFFIINPEISEEDMPESIREVYHGNREGNDYEKEYIKLFEKLKYCLILRKIGQSPSQAEAQLLGTSKYRRILGEHYSEFTLAIQLYASGVGAGALIYLRRIFEFLLEESHRRCINQEGWNEESYKKGHINEKIDLVEAQGEILIPVEMNSIRNKFYGALSKGIHSLSENECKDLFPVFRSLIEIILDARIAKEEKEKKIAEAVKIIQQV